MFYLKLGIPKANSALVTTSPRSVRMGIDVGGTFTKAVAVDMIRGEIIGKVTVPTTHSSHQGVSTGIVKAISVLMNEHAILDSEIELISHSTTQAVNALLEGDTAKVGIIGMGVGLDKANVVKRTNIKNQELSEKKYLQTCHRFVDTSRYLEEPKVMSTISELKKEGAQVLVVSEAYGVDDPSNEEFVTEVSDIPSVAGHQLAGIYGLEIRTLTAAINASILPTAIKTAKFVESAVKTEKSIPAPIMIMKGDGGVTDMKTFKVKPILTVLSGPAASIAGALLHLHILNGIFIEVGGTSTNVCIIRNGKPTIQYVTINEHPTCIRSLDVRVAGVAGGSLVRLTSNGRKLFDVGPRSAHIAGLCYSCFANPDEIEGGQLVTFKPVDGDPSDYVAIKNRDGRLFAITTTCAANALGVVKDDDYAKGNQSAAKIALRVLSEHLGMDEITVSKHILDLAARKILGIVTPMLKEYKLSGGEGNVVVIGGGGGASVLVPFVSQQLRFSYKKADHAEVISSIGVAAAMIHEEEEKTISDPDPENVSSMMETVKQRALAKGALPESINIQSEYVSERSLLRVTAMGNVSLDIGSASAKIITRQEADSLAYELFGTANVDKSSPMRLFDLDNYHVYSCKTEKKNLFLKSKKDSLLILDKYGKVRLSIENALVCTGNKEEVAEKIKTFISNPSNQKNSLSPQVHILDDTKLVDFSSLTSPDHVSRAVSDTLESTSAKAVAAIVKLK